jgi:hypothetical protein
MHWLYDLLQQHYLPPTPLSTFVPPPLLQMHALHANRPFLSLQTAATVAGTAFTPFTRRTPTSSARGTDAKGDFSIDGRILGDGGLAGMNMIYIKDHQFTASTNQSSATHASDASQFIRQHLTKID